MGILRFIKAIKVQSSTFSVGLRFYYWQYYENMDALPTNEQKVGVGIDNTHDHGGYKVSALFVKPKYGSFKEEIANYPFFTKEQYDEAKIKATKFMQSEEMKKMSVKYTYPKKRQMFLHYGISFGALVLFGHILSLILYTDYSKLSSAFSATFRQVHNF